MVSQPSAPNPYATANAQTQSNQASSQYNSASGNVNEVNPFGTVSYQAIEQVPIYSNGQISGYAPRYQRTTTLSPDQQKLFMEVSREAQKKIRELTESVDNLAKAKEILEAKGMKVNAADVASFRKLAEDKIWPGYKQQYGELWDKVVSAK